MPGPLDLANILLMAQGDAAAAPQGGGSALLNSPLFPLIMMLPLFYLLILRPQQVQQRKLRDAIDALKPRDKVITTMGLYGSVISIDKAADKVVLRVDDDSKMKLTFTRSSVARIVESAE